MTRDEALAKLRPMEAELRAHGISSLYLFGSIARGDAGPESDIDLMCELDDNGLQRLGFFELEELKDDLAKRLHKKVDLVQRRLLHARVARHADPDVVRIF